MNYKRFQSLPVWTPNEKSGARIKQLMKIIETKYNQKFSDYFEFHQWSIENIPEIWAELWDFMGIIYSKPYESVIDLNVPMSESPKWFEGARLNFAENLLKYRDDHVALIVTGENSGIERITYRQLYEKAKLYASAFRNYGLKKGDRVACYMSNRVEAILAMLAVTSIGAIWTGALPLLGSQAYLNRIQQVDPKFLITVDQFPHNKEQIYLLKNIQEIAEKLPTLEKVIIVRAKADLNSQDISSIAKSCFLEDFLEGGKNGDGSVPDLVFEQVSFSHPVFISYTSGTTGLPKTLVHGFGALLPGIRDFWIHWNSSRDDVWLSMSPVGWVSWNMVNNVLFVGETIALYEGVSYFQSPTYLWDLTEKINLSRIFITPSVMDELEFRGFLPTPKHHLSSLKMVLSAGSVVKPQNYDFALQKIKKDIIFNVAFGCTEIMGFCLITDETLPVYKGEISAPSLGVNFECLDEKGQPINGEMGEFIIKSPMPSLPLRIWNDEDGQKFKGYFSKYKGKFAIGDTIIVNPITKGIICCGRSDETLKPKGCRFGSSEIYNIVERFPEIRDSLCVSQYNKSKDERAVLFIKMQENKVFNQDLEERLREKIGNELSVRHIPEIIVEAPDIPRNANGKKVEIIVKKIINNMPFNAEMVVNQKCLSYYFNISQLQGF